MYLSLRLLHLPYLPPITYHLLLTYYLPPTPTTYYLYKTFFFSNTELNNLSMSLLDRLRSLSKLALILCASLKAISDLSERVVWTKNEHPSNRTPTPSGSLVTDVLTTQDQYYNPDTASYLVITF